jgi:ABC-type multidrug transport system fused ATPase/permease subunit
MPDPGSVSTTIGVFRAERWRIALTYGVTLLENLFYLFYPWTIGLAIDGLLADEGLPALVPLVAIWGLHIAISAARQVYDTWVFARIHAEIATATITRQRLAGIDTPEIAARSAMSRELVDFFEREVPTLITSALGLVGGTAMLFWYDWQVGLVVTVWMVPVTVVYTLMGRRAHRLNRDLNDETEREVDLIHRSRFGPLASHFRRRGRLRVRLSNTEARSWAGVEMFSVAAVVLASCT